MASQNDQKVMEISVVERCFQDDLSMTLGLVNNMFHICSTILIPGR